MSQGWISTAAMPQKTREQVRDILQDIEERAGEAISVCELIEELVEDEHLRLFGDESDDDGSTTTQSGEPELRNENERLRNIMQEQGSRIARRLAEIDEDGAVTIDNIVALLADVGERLEGALPVDTEDA